MEVKDIVKTLSNLLSCPKGDTLSWSEDIKLTISVIINKLEQELYLFLSSSAYHDDLSLGEKISFYELASNHIFKENSCFKDSFSPLEIFEALYCLNNYKEGDVVLWCEKKEYLFKNVLEKLENQK